MIHIIRLVALGILTLTACEGATPEWCAPIAGATATIRAADHSPAATLEEVWSVGGLTEGQEFVFPNAVAIDRKAELIAIADGRLGSIAIVTRTGEWRTRLAKAGQGPGEFLAPVAVAWTSADELALLDAGNAKMLVLTGDGRVVDEAAIDPGFIASLLGSGMMWAFLQDREIIGQPAPRPIADGPESEYVILRAQGLGERVDTIVRSVVRTFAPSGLTPVAVPGQAVPVAAPVGDSDLALAGDVPEYRVRIVDPSGAIVRQICWETEAVAFSAQETSGMENANIPGLRADLERARPTGSLARIGRVMADREGNIWVQRERASPLNMQDRFFGPPAAQFDIFNRNGEYTTSVKAPERARIATVAGDLAIGIRTGSLDEISVVGYRLRLAR